MPKPRSAVIETGVICPPPHGMAIGLASLHGGSLGNRAAAQGWLERARRTLEKVGPCVEWGYLELAFMACDRPDAIELERSARARARHRPRIRRSRPRGVRAGRRRARVDHAGQSPGGIRAARRGDDGAHRRRSSRPGNRRSSPSARCSPAATVPATSLAPRSGPASSARWSPSPPAGVRSCS